MKLPPLNAIKAFEATVRYGGFTAAAIELGVSSAAISLQVRKAEDFLGKQLFIRGNNSLSLTDAGHLLYPHVAQSLSGLASITEQFLEHEARSQLVISTLQSLADKWVAPTVARFRQTNPDIGIAVLIQNDPVDFARGRIDLRLTYGNQRYLGMKIIPVFRETVSPLCAPAFAKH
ncbi:LysR family transcriptional regulator, partial [Cypionkella sp.]|uniref:LysR family transcriptional regulator n=1 Tax=Cypionkella sp. TaxID=2811411 RepID=UPI002ABA286D